MNPSLRLAIALVIVTAFTSGCAVIDSHTSTKVSGQLISDETLGSVQRGITTEKQVIAMLGRPESTIDKGAGVRELIYRSKRVTRKSTELLLVIDSSSTSERVRTISFTVIDGVVEEVDQRTNSRSLDVDF
jgi:hypothetical protein